MLSVAYCATRALASCSVLGVFAALSAIAAPPDAVQETAWRDGIKAALYVTTPAPALSVENHGTFEPEPGIVAERVTYGTQFGLRIPAVVYRPKSLPGKSPGLIIVNGHGGDKFSWYAFYSGILYARAGAVVVTYDPAGEGERNAERKSGTRAHDKVEPPTELARRVGGLMVTDLMQAVSYLSERPDVDPKRLGAVGYSMGSFVLALTGAVETRLRACVLVGGGNLDGPDGYWDKSKAMCQGTPYRALAFLGDRPAVLYALHASRGPTLIYNGPEDTTVAIPTYGEAHLRAVRDRTEKLRTTDQGLFEIAFHPGTGHRPYFVTRPVALWLERQLDFPQWTPAAIESLPETHIAAWARQNAVTMDPLYATEHREGGTRALGADVPALPREALYVFTAEEWMRRKASMIHESWLREAKARIGATKP